MLSWLYRLFGSPFALSIEAPCDLPDLGIRAGDTLDYDPMEQDVIIHVRLIYRNQVEAVMRRRRFRCVGGQCPASPAVAEPGASSPTAESAPAACFQARPYLRLLP